MTIKLSSIAWIAIEILLCNLGDANGETPGWMNKWPHPTTRVRHTMAYDSARGRTVLFGGVYGGINFNETWEYDGTSWTVVAMSGPSARNSHAMAYDSFRQRTVLFGGSTGGNETWEWDGATWVLAATSGPSARSGHAMSYDSVRQRTVLFGGSTGGNETWEWNGTTWTLMATTGISPRSYHAMAFDSVRNRTVLFGGYGGPNPLEPNSLSGTWEWDGVAWLLQSSSGPAARFAHTVAFDSVRQRIVLFGGRGPIEPSARFGDTWEWDGVTWTQRASTGPAGRDSHAMAFDSVRGRTVIFAGTRGFTGTSLPSGFEDTWEWDGASWILRSPSRRYSSAMAFDPTDGTSLLFAGWETGIGYLGDTWKWNGASWALLGAAGPSLRAYFAMSTDSLRGRIVLFGGYGIGGYKGDTWEWTGSSWTQASPTNAPTARYAYGLAFDSVRGRTILFGGYDAGIYRGDTWEWDGADWVERLVAGPSPRGWFSMAFDQSRGRLVLFGGFDGTSRFGDTWEWDGTNWSLVSSTGPTPRDSYCMIYDTTRQVVVLFGGYDPVLQNDTWEWNGSTWTRRTLSGPPPRQLGSMSYDSIRDRVVLFGGWVNSGTFLDDTWEYRGIRLGDMNEDGRVDGLDIQPFAVAIVDGSLDPDDVYKGDMDSDGAIGPADLDPFVNVLIAANQ